MKLMLLLLLCLTAVLALAVTKAPPLVTVTIFSEVPVLYSTDATNRTMWTLQHPTWTHATACYRNGLRQSPGTDYYVAYDRIIAVWALDDRIICDYHFQQ